MLVFWAVMGHSHPAQSKAIGILSCTEKDLLKKGELGLPRCGTWPCVSHTPEVKVFLFSWALLIVHPFTTPFITD